MGYENNNAKATGKNTERIAAEFLNRHGFIATRPEGKDTGIDLDILEPNTDRRFTAQVKGRGRAAEPRWFQVSIGEKQVERACDENRLATVWLDKISKTDFWVLVSLPLNEVWVIPSAEIIEIARANESQYAGRLDNRYDTPHHKPNGAIAKKQKELNLDISIGNQFLWQRYLHYRNSVGALQA